MCGIFFRAVDVQVAFKNSLSEAASGVSPSEKLNSVKNPNPSAQMETVKVGFCRLDMWETTCRKSINTGLDIQHHNTGLQTADSNSADLHACR